MDEGKNIWKEGIMGAISGGLAALYYGYGAIPKSWTFEIKKYMLIVRPCEKAEQII